MGSVITLCTDFGLADGYVASMRGVILGRAPGAQIVDITHEIAPQDVRAAAFVLLTTYAYFPQGTIHVVVVDPGVGSERRILAAQSAHYAFVAPDNGVLGYVLAEEPPHEVVAISNRTYWRDAVSYTFHGRDIMAPVAASLAEGAPLRALGEAIDDWMRMDLPPLHESADGILVGEVIHIDRFGNAITNIPATKLVAHPGWHVTIGALEIDSLSPTYAAVAPGAALALVGSHGYLEIAVREGSAALSYGARTGDHVVVAPRR